MTPIRKSRHRDAKPKGNLFTELLNIRVSEAVDLMDDLKIREFAKQYPEKTFKDMLGELATAWKSEKENCKKG